MFKKIFFNITFIFLALFSHASANFDKFLPIVTKGSPQNTSWHTLATPTCVAYNKEFTKTAWGFHNGTVMIFDITNNKWVLEAAEEVKHEIDEISFNNDSTQVLALERNSFPHKTICSKTSDGNWEMSKAKYEDANSIELNHDSSMALTIGKSKSSYMNKNCIFFLQKKSDGTYTSEYECLQSGSYINFYELSQLYNTDIDIVSAHFNHDSSMICLVVIYPRMNYCTAWIVKKYETGWKVDLEANPGASFYHGRIDYDSKNRDTNPENRLHTTTRMHQVKDINFNNDSSMVVVTHYNNAAIVWHRDKDGRWHSGGKDVIQCSGNIVSAAFTPDSRIITVSSINTPLDSAVQIWSRNSQGVWQDSGENNAPKGYAAFLRSASLSHDASTLLTTSSDGRANLWKRDQAGSWATDCSDILLDDNPDHKVGMANFNHDSSKIICILGHQIYRYFLPSGRLLRVYNKAPNGSWVSDNSDIITQSDYIEITEKFNHDSSVKITANQGEGCKILHKEQDGSWISKDVLEKDELTRVDNAHFNSDSSAILLLVDYEAILFDLKTNRCIAKIRINNPKTARFFKIKNWLGIEEEYVEIISETHSKTINISQLIKCANDFSCSNEGALASKLTLSQYIFIKMLKKIRKEAGMEKQTVEWRILRDEKTGEWIREEFYADGHLITKFEKKLATPPFTDEVLEHLLNLYNIKIVTVWVNSTGQQKFSPEDPGGKLPAKV